MYRLSSHSPLLLLATGIFYMSLCRVKNVSISRLNSHEINKYGILRFLYL